jgi:predicted nucleotidyltransferase
MKFQFPVESRSTIQQLADDLARAASVPAKIVLFGSHARGEQRESSDVDLLVLEAEIKDRPSEYFRLLEVVGMRNVDLILMKESDYHRRTGWVGSLPYYVNREGVVLHG